MLKKPLTTAARRRLLAETVRKKEERTRRSKPKIPKEKLCIGCKVTFSSVHFHKRTASKDGLQALCKVCALKAWHVWNRKRTQG